MMHNLSSIQLSYVLQCLGHSWSTTPSAYDPMLLVRDAIWWSISIWCSCLGICVIPYVILFDCLDNCLFFVLFYLFGNYFDCKCFDCLCVFWGDPAHLSHLLLLALNTPTPLLVLFCHLVVSSISHLHTHHFTTRGSAYDFYHFVHLCIIRTMPLCLLSSAALLTLYIKNNKELLKKYMQ